jgi:hypothetical protein
MGLRRIYPIFHQFQQGAITLRHNYLRKLSSDPFRSAIHGAVIDNHGDKCCNRLTEKDLKTGRRIIPSVKYRNDNADHNFG